jgi:hypothetical protein
MSEKMNVEKDDEEREVMETAADESPRKSGKKSFKAWWEERSLAEKILVLLGFATAGLGLMALLGLAVMLLWNWLMPDLFGLKQVNYWQAWGLLILSWILFKGFGSNNTTSSSTERKRKQQLRRYMKEGERADSAAD